MAAHGPDGGAGSGQVLRCPAQRSGGRCVELERDAVGVTQLEDGARADVLDAAVLDAEAVERCSGCVQQVQRGHRERDVVQADPVRGERVPRGGDGAQAEQAARPAVDDPAEQEPQLLARRWDAVQVGADRYGAAPVRLTGAGLVLREWEPRDLAAMIELFDDPEVARRTPLPSPFGPAEAAARLARAQQREHLFLAVTTDGDRPLGEVLLGADGNLGYVLGPAHRGQGLAVRAVTLLREHAHAQGFPVLHLEIEPDNAASRAVARGAGFALVRPAAEVVVDKGREVVLDRWEHRPA